jgi:hypothetical protein
LSLSWAAWIHSAFSNPLSFSISFSLLHLSIPMVSFFQDFLSQLCNQFSTLSCVLQALSISDIWRGVQVMWFLNIQFLPTTFFSAYPALGNRDSGVSIAIGYGLDDWEVEDRVPVG